MMLGNGYHPASQYGPMPAPPATSALYGGASDPLYGYAHSEPPNGVYGTLQRRPSGGRQGQIF